MNPEEQPPAGDAFLALGMAGVYAEGGTATDAATLSSDAAVGGSVGGGSGDRHSTASAAVVGGCAPFPEACPPVAGLLTAVALAAPNGADKSSGGGGHHINAHARQRHYRKRALSTATSGSMAAAAAARRGGTPQHGNNHHPGGPTSNLSGVSLMDSTIGSNIMSSGAEHGIVSFGLSFNFDGTSSPSNSDSGEAVNDGKGGEGSSEDDNNNNNGNPNSNNNGKAKAKNNGNNGAGGHAANKSGGDDTKKKKSHHHKHHKAKTPSPANKNNSSSKDGVKASGGSNEGKASKTSSSSKSKSSSKANKKKRSTSVKFDPNSGAPAATTGEEGSGSSTSSSDSSMNDMNNDSGGSSGGSNSGNDGSSGGKSTVSSLTTSSNQEWMATNESAEAERQAAVDAAQNGQVVEANKVGGNKGPGENGVADGKAQTAMKKDQLSGKKRKKVSIIAPPNKMKEGANGAKKSSSANANPDGGNEDDDGYKTDEEQWGGNRNADGTLLHQGGLNACLPGQNPMASHKGSSSGVMSLLKSASSGSAASSSKKSGPKDEGGGPPMKQARFSIDHGADAHHHVHHQGHPQAVQSADASAQPLSSLSGSDSAGVPAVTNSSVGQTVGLSSSSATEAATSSNPSGSSGPIMMANPDHNASNPKKRSKISFASSGDAGAENHPDKRKERNAREKERSCRIARQIDDLRSLLSRGGVIVSKGTKSSVLAEAATYINILQQQQVQWEMDKQALMQQMQQIGVTPNPSVGGQTGLPQNEMSMGGAVLPNGDAAQPGLPQQQQMMAQQPGMVGGLPVQPQQQLGMAGLPGQPQQQLPGQVNALGQVLPNSINSNDYKFIFNNSSVGMAIASLGGAFVDCNAIFCQLSEFTKEEVCSMTIFNMTSRQDLQHAFDLISQMITPTLEGQGGNQGGASSSPQDNSKGPEDKSSIVLRGAMKKRSDLGLSISLIKGDHGIAKCFCVTLVRILSMEATRPDTVSIEMELPQVWSTKQQKNVGFGATPAYTSG